MRKTGIQIINNDDLVQKKYFLYNANNEFD